MIGELLVANTPKATNPTDALVAQAILRNTRVTPQKARRVINLIRGERADVALTTLKFAPQEVGADLYTLLNSAINNAKQKSPSLRDASELYIVEALVDEAPTLKRFRPRAQGRGFQILKRASTLTLVVSTDRSYRPHGLKKVVNAKANPNKVVLAKPEAPVSPAPTKKAATKKAATKKAAAKKVAPTEEVAVATEGQAE
jgi:large subunit ribosomal protein L22